MCLCKGLEFLLSGEARMSPSPDSVEAIVAGWLPLSRHVQRITRDLPSILVGRDRSVTICTPDCETAVNQISVD